MDSPDHAEPLALLERFVVENDALADLEAEIGRLNIFDALGIVHAEIRHSNFLAWLLDPHESHGQGQLFLNAVLMDLLRNAPRADRPMSPVDLDGADLRGVQVRREWQHIDLLIVIDEPRVVIAIENKISSSEHSDQLKRYKQTVHAHFPNHRPFFVFLTREGDEPSEEAWCPYDFGQLHTALDRCVRRNENSIGEEVRVFIGHYLAMLRSRFMDDPKIVDLCRRIYRQHRRAIDLINTHVDVNTEILDSFIAWLKSEHPTWEIDEIYEGSGYASICFSPRIWSDNLPKLHFKQEEFTGTDWIFARLLIRSADPERVVFDIHMLYDDLHEQVMSMVEKIRDRGGASHLTINKRRMKNGEQIRLFKQIVVGGEGSVTESELNVLLEKVKSGFNDFQKQIDSVSMFLTEVADESS